MTVSARVLRIGISTARKVFEKRGNHTEAHIGEHELAALLAMAAEAGARGPLTALRGVRAALEREVDEHGDFEPVDWPRALQLAQDAEFAEQQCCERDSDGDGNCDRHPAAKVRT